MKKEKGKEVENSWQFYSEYLWCILGNFIQKHFFSKQTKKENKGLPVVQCPWSNQAGGASCDASLRQRRSLALVHINFGLWSHHSFFVWKVYIYKAKDLII